METHSPSLGERIASLRGTAQVLEPCAWVPDSVHALIMACLARIFGRLEQLFLFWQSGSLPATYLTLARHPAAAMAVAPRHICAAVELRPRGRTHQSNAPGTHATAVQMTPVRRPVPTFATPIIASPRAAIPSASPRRRAARDPPPACNQKPHIRANLVTL